MGASYNTILVAAVEREAIVAAVRCSLHRLGYRIVHREEPAVHEDGFHYRSVQVIFIGPPRGSPWVPLSSWGDGLSCGFPEWYRANPLAMSLSEHLSPVIYLFSYSAGYVAGYSIFEGGRQVEAQSLTGQRDVPLGDFTPSPAQPEGRSAFATLLGDAQFDFPKFIRGFPSLEVGTAGLAARLGLSVHLIDPLDIRDGDGALVVDGGQYKPVSLPGWLALYYERVR